MRFSLLSMVRVVALLAVGLTILAVGVSRLDPPGQVQRTVRPTTAVAICDYFLKVADHRPRWVDSETGEITVVPVEADDVLEAASCSPWTDEAGNRQVVGRWSSRTWEGPRTVIHAFGLGRYSFPDGRLLNHVSCNVVPVGPPCWYPGTQARVLFAAGDGKLYRFAFEMAEASDPRIEPNEPIDREPIVLTWACPQPGVGGVFIADISWSSDSRMAHHVIASMRIQEQQENGAIRFTRTQIWGLKLNPSGTQIVAATPLVNHDLSQTRARRFDERSPVVASLPDGSLALAYTRQSEGRSNWSVCLAAIAVDADKNLVATRESRTQAYQTHGQPAPITFSPDGKWLSVLLGPLDADKRVVRYSTTRLITAQAQVPDHPEIRTR